MKKFRSKTGIELLIPVILLMGFFLYLSVTEKTWLGTGVTLLAILFFIYLFSTTEYIIFDRKLEIKCGVFYDKWIDIYRIKKITAVTDFFAAPATSVQRLEIYFDEINSVEISPKDKDAFINSLLTINPAIQVKK